MAGFEARGRTESGRAPGRAGLALPEERRGTAHAVGSRGRTGHASAGGLVVDLALRRGRGLDAAAALARQPWAGARGGRSSPARPPAPETRERALSLRGGWRRPSKRHASERSPDAPFAFKGS